MKKIIKTTAILLILAGIFSCGKDKDNDENNVPVSLEGTKWKMAGIVDVRTGKLKELEPKDCDKCYTLVFNSDSTANGKSVLNRIHMELSPKTFIGTATYMDDSGIGNVQLFYDAIKTIDSYKFVNNELRFFYNSKQNYLLFKFVKL
jgi:hypothetical protein